MSGRSMPATPPASFLRTVLFKGSETAGFEVGGREEYRVQSSGRAARPPGAKAVVKNAGKVLQNDIARVNDIALRPLRS